MNRRAAGAQTYVAASLAEASPRRTGRGRGQPEGLRKRAFATFGPVSPAMHRLRRVADAITHQDSRQEGVPIAAQQAALTTAVGTTAKYELPAPGEDWGAPPQPMTDEQKFFFVRRIRSQPSPMKSCPCGSDPPPSSHP